MNAFVIDVFEFCRLRERREGEIAVVNLPRLEREVVDKSGKLRWSLQSGGDIHGHPRMDLMVSGSVALVCQRCLTPVVFAIESTSVLVLARDEDGADDVEALLEDEVAEVVVGSEVFNIVDLVEDEALLAFPQSPRHEACSGRLPLSTSNDAEGESPFAVLKNLRQ